MTMATRSLRRLHSARDSPRPPGPTGLPILGNALDYTRDTLAFITRSAREYGPVVYWNIAGRPFYQLNDPDDIERVLVRDSQQYLLGTFNEETLDPLLGRGLLTSEGAFWRQQRNLIQPAFDPRRIEEYATIMTERTEAMLDRWQDGETRSIHDDMTALTLEIIAETMFGVDIRDRTTEIGAALDGATDQSDGLSNEILPGWLPTPGRRRFERAVATLDEVVAEIIRERRANPTEKDVISTLLTATDADGNEMSHRQVRDEVVTLLVAGHETTALTLTFVFFLLAQHPTIEAKLVAELDDVLDGRTPTVADTPALTYTDRIVTESMRLYPPVHSTVREPIEDVEIGGYTIPAGAAISIDQWAVHRDPQWYPDPMAFRPERWTTEFEASLPRFAYFPFGGGPRQCIGNRFALMEARLLLATIAQRFHLELVSSPSLDLTANVTIPPKEPIEMVAHAR